jgi:hypothetical protein
MGKVGWCFLGGGGGGWGEKSERKKEITYQIYTQMGF